MLVSVLVAGGVSMIITICFQISYRKSDLKNSKIISRDDFKRLSDEVEFLKSKSD